jgi:hypothetical protein
MTFRQLALAAGRVNLLANEMSISLLLIRQGLKVLLDLQPHDARRGIGQVAAEFLGVHGASESKKPSWGSRETEIYWEAARQGAGGRAM